MVTFEQLSNASGMAPNTIRDCYKMMLPYLVVVSNRLDFCCHAVQQVASHMLSRGRLCLPLMMLGRLSPLTAALKHACSPVLAAAALPSQTAVHPGRAPSSHCNACCPAAPVCPCVSCQPGKLVAESDAKADVLQQLEAAFKAAPAVGGDSKTTKKAAK